MSSTNKTQHLSLNQWVGTDPFRMSDFNADNQKIDAAHAATAEAIAANTQLIATKPNLVVGSYTGTGTHGASNPTGLTFDFEPKLVIIRTPTPNSKNNHMCGMTLVRGTDMQYSDTYGSGSSFCYVTWSGNRVQWYSTAGHAGDQCNHSGAIYYYIAFG